MLRELVLPLKYDNNLKHLLIYDKLEGVNVLSVRVCLTDRDCMRNGCNNPTNRIRTDQVFGFLQSISHNYNVNNAILKLNYTVLILVHR